MEYKRFIQLMNEPGNVESETVGSLQELIKEFPYFQSAHLLLARSMKEQEHIRYERQLKLASAYAPDRKVLYSLLNDKKNKKEAPVRNPEKEIPSPFILVDEQEMDVEEQEIKRDTLISNPFIEPSVSIPAAKEDTTHESGLEVPEVSEEQKTKEIIPEPSKEISIPVTEVSEQVFVPAAESTTTDPREILKRRLSEILGNTQEDSKEVVQKQEKKSDNAESIPVKAPKLNDETATLSQKDVSEPKENPQKPSVPSDNILDTLSGIPEPIIPLPPPPDRLSELLPEDTSKSLDTIEKLELEYAMEETLLSSLEKLPVIEGNDKRAKVPPAPAEKEAEHVEESIQSDDTRSPRSFSSWLQKLSGKEYGKVEIVHADDEPGASSTVSHPDTRAEGPSGESIPQTEQEELVRKAADKEKIKPSVDDGISRQKKELIDKFIATEPKIVPSKIEFYSPVTQAKRSLEEYDDVVSETLASIYKQQGNNLKARFCYEKLSLFYPEKRTYFAALIKEIDEELNRSNQEDL